MKKLLIFIITLLFLTSCEHKESPVVIIVTTPHLTSNPPSVKGGENLIFHIEAHANEAAFSKFRISMYNSVIGTQVLLDSTCFTKELSFDYNLKAPSVLNTSNFIFTFDGYDTKGNTGQTKTEIFVITDDRNIKESDNIVIYSAYSGNKSGLMLPNFELYSINYTKDGLTNDSIHIYDRKIVSVPDTLSRTWTSSSKCNLKFAKNEGFDYGGATVASIKAAYTIAVKTNEVSQIKNGDIILFGKGEVAYGAIKIKQVYDLESAKDDRYEFSIKELADSIK